jgi:hypothetical protein
LIVIATASAGRTGAHPWTRSHNLTAAEVRMLLAVVESGVAGFAGQQHPENDHCLSKLEEMHWTGAAAFLPMTFGKV